MRRDFHPLLLDHMRKDDRIVVLTADLGFKMFDQIAAEFPGRFWNVGAAEQLLIGAAVGLAEDGKIPVCYSITSFLLWRPAEWWRNYVNAERVPIKAIGGGRDQDYCHDGWTHDCSDAKAFLSLMPNVKQFWPDTVADLPAVTQEWLYHDGPAFLSLRR